MIESNLLGPSINDTHPYCVQIDDYSRGSGSNIETSFSLPHLLAVFVFCIELVHVLFSLRMQSQILNVSNLYSSSIRCCDFQIKKTRSRCIYLIHVHISLCC